VAEQEFPQELLDAAQQAVSEAPAGRTAAQVALRVAQILAEPGQPSPRRMPRGRMLAVLGELESRGTVTRRPGQASVTFHPAEEDSHGE
jgi:hypothetical protein